VLGVQNGDAGLYMLISGLAATILGFLAPIIARWLGRGTEVAQSRRDDFGAVIAGMQKVLDEKDQELDRCRAEKDAEVARLKDDVATLETRHHARIKQVHDLNNLVHSYIIRFGNIEAEPDEEGETP